MGNSLLGMAPTAIHGIEHYLADVGEFQFGNSLGSTRFLKAARCRHYEGECVVKVLAVEDPSLPLSAHKARIERLSRDTVRNVSIAAYHRVAIYTNFAFMSRQYVRYSLYDRLSTRPFLTHFEKCWIAYQLIKCIEWCHSKGIQHGDLKLENILITSNLWLVFVDFATYKPVFLPHDNPSDFSYFFDTSRRRCCNIAPERFVSESFPNQNDALLSQTVLNQSTEPQLTQQMDMFSVGCVLAELFSEDAPNGNLFDLANLLAYRCGQYYPEKAINSISSDDIRDLVKNLIDLEPTNRKLSAQILTQLKPKTFPSYFDTLYEYIQQVTRLPPDAKIIRLAQDIDNHIEKILDEEPQGLLLLLVLITSTMRALKHIHCKIESQRLACKIAKTSPVMSIYITDRLLPYLLDALTDSDARVRAEAIDSITFSLEQVIKLSQSDNNVFTDYILPYLCQVVCDRSVFVRLRLASNISRLAKIAHNFLSQSCDQNYEDELALLHEAFQSIVSQLLTDPSNDVRRTLLLTPNSCANLCVFFGRQRTNDVILSHIITFLNDKADFQLRASFFDNIIVIASYLGSQCSTILQPLIQQGLSDPEETIIYKAIASLSSLIEQGLLNKSIIYELIREALPLLSHPNRWINNALIQLILTLASRLSLADINCKIKPLVDPHLSRSIHLLKNGPLLIDSLYDLIPRSIYDLLVTSKLNIEQLFESLTHRKILRSTPRYHQSSHVSDDPLYIRLTHEGMNEQIEDQLLRLSDLIKKINRNKKNLHLKKLSGNIAITKRNSNRRCFSILLRDPIQEKPSHKKQASTMNEEWLHMFGSNAKLISSTDEDVINVIPIAHEAREYDQSHIQCPPCQREINKLVMHKKIEYTPIGIKRISGSTTFRPKGVLVAHLHEHESSVQRVIRIGETSLFATCSLDGTVKIWDVSRMEGKSVANRSQQTYSAQSSLDPQSIRGMTYCKDYIIAFSSNNNIHVLEINSSSSRMRLVFGFTINPSTAGSAITDICTLNDNQFAVSISDSTILGYDLRIIHNDINTEVKPIWKLKVHPHERLLTCIDGNDVVLFSGTSRGILITFDLRFQLRTQTTYYPSQNRIRRIKCADEGLYTAAQGNCELSLWDCETGSRIKTLWASNTPILSTTQSSHNSILGMILINSEKDSSIITCSSDMKLRFWDLTTPDRSYLISDNGKNGNNNNNNVKYTAKFIEGTQVIQECQQENQQLMAQQLQHSSWDQQTVLSSHRDCISDITRVNHLLISASNDGVVKVWK